MSVTELAGVWESVLSPRLQLRRPTEDDRDFWVALHSDPRLWTHAPHLHTDDPARLRASFAACLRHWDQHGFGYWVVEDDSPVGVAGVRDDGSALNLYYRFVAEAHGHGYATEAAVAAVALASEWLGDRPVRAVVRPGHERSLRTAARAGLVEVGTIMLGDDLPDEPPSVVLEAPMSRATAALSASEREEALDLWSAVNAAGGAVGFPGRVSLDDVAEALTGHESAMAAGDGLAVLLREPGIGGAGELVGMGFVERTGRRLFPHVVDLKRVMIAPDRQGRSYGRLLMAGLHRTARQLGGVELIRLDYRSGTGVGSFYERCSYVEVGRHPGVIRVAPGDDRDSVLMMRRLDGRPLAYDGRG